VLYYQAFGDLLDYIGLPFHFELIIAIVHSLAMLTIVLLLCMAFRKMDVSLAIIAGAGAHLVSFTSIDASARAQNAWVSIEYTPLFALIGLVVLAVVLGIIGVAIRLWKRRMELTRNDTFMDRTDDLENDFGSMAFSVCFTMMFRFILTGHHPKDDDTEFDHGAWERTCMFIYGCVMLAIAIPMVMICSRMGDAAVDYTQKRIYTFVSSCATLNVVWAFLYWGEWEFFEEIYLGRPIFARVMFSVVASIICLVGIVALANLTGNGSSQKAVKVALTALGLIVAFSWELCFDASIDDMCEGDVHPARLKVLAAVFMGVIVLPVYGYYMKPISMKAAEAIGS